MIKKIVNIFKDNIIIILGVIVGIFIELFAITYTSCIPFLTMPIYSLIILVFLVSILLLINKKVVNLIISTFLLITVTIIDTVMIFLYDSNGTAFEWAMFNQRTDATGTLESYDLQYGFIAICLSIILIFIGSMIRYLIKNKDKIKNIKNSDKKKKVLISLIFLTSISIIAIPKIQTNLNLKDGYSYKIYDTTSNNYQTMGITSNLIYQLIKGKIYVDKDDISDVEDFIYEDKIDKSIYNGISKENNLILIMVESFEWYPLTLYSEYKDKLYPNISRLLDEGIVGENYYQKEKTDVSEAIAVLGNYPTGQYINYDFYENEYPFSLPSLLRNSWGNEAIINSFHANYGNFYNRYKLHESIGFSKLYAIDEMNEYGVTDTWNHKKGERNLDSITFEKMKEVMFPTDEQFFSFILSFSMHGYYKERENLSDYYDIIDKYIEFDEDNINDEYLKTYMAALMDFDKAIGIMLDYLGDNNMLDTTTIVMYADHNTYYNKLSNYAKDIDEKYNSELYHLPFIIYDKKLYDEYVNNNDNNSIDKFITASDILPTILDLFGVDGYKNLYFGTSVLVDDIESILYSRNYNIFITDKFVGYSLNSPIYKSDDITKKDLKNIESRSLTLLEKLEYIDKIYYSNYFKNHKYKY